MKKVFHILFVLVVVFTFSSCGSDDEKELISFEGDCKQIVEIKGYAGQSIQTDPPVISKLSDMLSGSPNYGPSISTGEFYPVGTSVKITGLKEGTTLSGFVLTINGVSQSFGDVKLLEGSTEYTLYSNKYLDFFRNGFNKMVSKKQLETSLKFTPSEDIAATDNVKLEIVYRGKFSYWVKK